ncbi:DUF1329 domain-containing protein [Pseudoduganella namucuonensis]|uniref:DUF1329 domain-containing protein n=1 Tax=Pseudoduganella namucuonensis TaxID=1035707 RepID=A0A1I7FPE5_9BURK|nr:DUF1329 domain-containing protein [Pseudoduganella namucuonensis]SFU38064.1 Protein of unknown function [Pseudoduganella namucuonensis]
MKTKSLFSLTLVAALVAGAGGAGATMTAQELERLGKDLTPMGAEKAGNKDGTIPAWDGGLPTIPPGVDPKEVYADPFPKEKPLYTITAANLQQYQGKLTAGQIEMLKRFPEYKMLVYPSHRTAALEQSEYDHIKAEAGKAALAEGGNGILNVKNSSVPFPMPKSGVEAIWNHMTRHRGGSFIRYTSLLPVQANGAFTPVVRIEHIAMASKVKNAEPNRLMYYMRTDTAPSSQAGTALLDYEPLDQVKEQRLVWTYNPGSRRVMRAPDVSYDSPAIGSDGLATQDDFDGFNGAPDRFDWKLIGKKEMIVSYNNNRLIAKQVKPTDIVRPGHMNQDLVRYEMHRVWVVEATLKPGKRHVYSKRVFYIDEDSWALVHADNFDGRGELWRVHEMHGLQYSAAPAYGPACDVIYDLQARRYLVSSLVNASKPFKYHVEFDLSSFSVDAMRRFAN